MRRTAGSPCYLNGSGRGALPPDHELFFQHSRRSAVAAADVVCVVGTPLDFRLKFGRFNPDAKLVHVHGDPAELGRNRAPDAGLVGDCAAVLGILADGVKNRRGDDAWLERLRAAEAAWWDENRAAGRVRERPAQPLSPGQRARPCARPRHDRDRRRRRRGRRRAPASCASTGPGTGSTRARSAASASVRRYALGVKAARPDAQVVVIAGDGAFGLNGFEFETLIRFGLPVVFVIGNDAAWGEIRIPQRGIYGEDAEVATLLAPSPLRPAHARPSAATESTSSGPTSFAPALERALASGEPAIVNVMLDPLAMAGHAYRGM